MKVLIVEDEKIAADRLISLLQSITPNLAVLAYLETCEDTVKYLLEKPAPELIFLDIHLADGHSFEIFNQIQVPCPIIFVTAYNQYALKAFDVNGLHYLLKPVKISELKEALNRFNQLGSSNTDYKAILDNIKENQRKSEFKQRFLVKVGDQLKMIGVDHIAYFFSQDGFTHLRTTSNDTFIIDNKLEDLGSILDPSQFFRVNRKFVVSIESIKKMFNHFNSRLKLELVPVPDGTVVVSKDRVADFKAWLEGRSR